MKNCFLILAILALSACSTIPENGLKETHYEATKHVFLSDVLPPPPVTGSPADKQDMAAVMTAQKTRTKSQVAEAQLDVERSVFRFSPVLGDQFTPENFPITAAFFKKVTKDGDRDIKIAKDYYKRERPYTTNSLVKPIVPQPHNASYPSGHASFAYVSAILLAKMLPEKAPQIYQRANEFAYNRVIAGAHYPTDVEASKIAAAVIVHNLLQDKEFMAEFTQAKNELRYKLLQP